MSSPRKQSLLGELIALRPAGQAGSASAVYFPGELRSPGPTAIGAACGGDRWPSAGVQ